MFTGIIDHFGALASVRQTPQSRVLNFASQFRDFQLGESIAVNGACLTVAEFDENTFSVSVSPETLKLTNLKKLRVGDKVNFERALRMGDRLGGHLVTGHVDCMVRVALVETCGEYRRIVFSQVPEAHRKLVVKKGSIAVNGVSLTINEANRREGTFEVMLIPHTLQITTLSELKEGASVNIEFDSTVKTILERIEELLPGLLENRISENK